MKCRIDSTLVQERSVRMHKNEMRYANYVLKGKYIHHQVVVSYGK